MHTEEEYKIFRKVEKDFRIEDIKSRIEDNYKEPTEEQLERIYQKVEKTLSNNDSYYESYWLSIEYCLDEELERI